MSSPWLEAALDLQNCDMQIRRLRQRLEMIPVERRHFETESKTLTAGCETARMELMQQESRLKTLENEATAEDNLIQKHLMQSSLIRKQEEYDATMLSIENAKKRRSDIETEELMLMDTIEESRKTLSERMRNDKERQAEIKEELTGLRELEAEIKEAVKAKSAEREELRTFVPEHVLGMYERLLARGKGMPLAAIVDGVCQNCNISVTQQEINDVKRGDVVNCNCSQILYLP